MIILYKQTYFSLSSLNSNFFDLFSTIVLFYFLCYLFLFEKTAHSNRLKGY